MTSKGQMMLGWCSRRMTFILRCASAWKSLAERGRMRWWRMRDPLLSSLTAYRFMSWLFSTSLTLPKAPCPSVPTMMYWFTNVMPYKPHYAIRCRQAYCACNTIVIAKCTTAGQRHTVAAVSLQKLTRELCLVCGACQQVGRLMKFG